MSRKLRVGRPFGIDVDVDASWIVVALFMAWHATTTFAKWHPTWSLGAAAFLGTVASLLAFGLVLGRQLVQARVANALGVTVRRMRLFAFGGVWQTEPNVGSPRAELWTATAGAMVSLAVGLAIIAAERVLHAQVSWGALEMPAAPTHSSLSPLSTLLLWLGGLNLALGVLNLVPALPLDGGRVLRTAVSRATGDLARATRVVSDLGRVFGWSLVVGCGVAVLVGANLHGFRLSSSIGIWLALIGWSLVSAHALVEERRLDAVIRRRPRCRLAI